MAKENILIVDDEKDILELLCFNLKKEGYNTFTAVPAVHLQIPFLLQL